MGAANNVFASSANKAIGHLLDSNMLSYQCVSECTILSQHIKNNTVSCTSPTGNKVTVFLNIIFFKKQFLCFYLGHSSSQFTGWCGRKFVFRFGESDLVYNCTQPP